MLCEICKKNQATFFYKQTKNGVTVEKNLCSACAKEQGLSVSNGFFESADFGIDNFFGGLLGSFATGSPKIVAARKCPMCSTEMGEIVRSGKVGCAKCYEVFKTSLIPTVTKIHGNVAHCGKVPAGRENISLNPDPAPLPQNEAPAEKEPSAQEQLLSLKQKLAEAIELQEYEMAAQYRDRIKELEKELLEGGEEK